MLRLALGLLVAVGCGGGPCPVAHPAEPVAETREHCLAPPWTASGTELSGFVRQEVSETGREQWWLRPGNRTPAIDELAPLIAGARLEERLHADHADVGMCGDRALPPGHVCVRLRFFLCDVRVEDAIAAVAERIAAPALADAAVGIHVHLIGEIGPRCAEGDPVCGPLPYDGTLADAGYDCHAERVLAADEWPEIADRMRGYTGGACRHDGQCMVAGCGNHCVSWDSRVAEGTCEAYTVLEDAPALCGCVEGACAWFVD